MTNGQTSFQNCDSRHLEVLPSMFFFFFLSKKENSTGHSLYVSIYTESDQLNFLLKAMRLMVPSAG